VFEGESAVAAHNHFLGSVEIKGLQSQPRGMLEVKQNRGFGFISNIPTPCNNFTDPSFF